MLKNFYSLERKNHNALLKYKYIYYQQIMHKRLNNYTRLLLSCLDRKFNIFISFYQFHKTFNTINLCIQPEMSYKCYYTALLLIIKT